MKIRKIRLIGSLLSWAALILASSLQAQYSVTWSRIAGGGGTSSGGGYSLNGTVGQHDVGPPMSGAGYAMLDGFWSGINSGQNAPPWLGISLSNNIATLYWPLSAVGFNLEQTSFLSLPNIWTTIPTPYLSNATSFYFSIVSPTGQRYFRLQKP